MKNKIRNLSSLAIFGAILFTANAAVAQAQFTSPSAITYTSTPTPITSDGTVSEFSPDTIVVKSTASTFPLSYSCSKTTTYVDENGIPVSIENVKSGLPVTVYYDKEGDRMVATKVIVRSAATVDPTAPVTQASTTTTTSAGGTITQYSPDGIVVQTTTSANPVSYSSTKTTTYVDENGDPVSSETIKSGAPVTVYYDTEDGKMVATKVIVKKSTTTTTTSAAP